MNYEGEPLKISPNNDSVTNGRNKVVETIANLLDAESIAHIIYIDDKFDVESQKAEFVGRVKSLKYTQKYIHSGSFSEFNWEGPEELISKLWDESTQKSLLLNEICRFENDDESANVIPTLEIINYFGSKIIALTPDKWKEDNYNLIKSLDKGKKALCLFDFQFQSGNKLIEGRNGVELAKLLLEQDHINEKVVCGIFSHTFREEYEDDVRLQYATQYGIDKTRFYTISKYRYSFDPFIAGFSEGIKNLLLQPYVEFLKLESLDVLKKSNEKASERINEITPKTFNQIIQKSSLKEGVWEVSTLFRLYGILSKEENFNMISDPTLRQKFNNSIKRIREIDLTDTGYSSTIKNQQLVQLKNSELYLKGDVVNKLHLPLANGDIFVIKDREYVLLVQPCNLALRAKDADCGKRDYNYDAGILVPIRDIPKEKLNITYEEVKVAETSDKFFAAYFPGFQIISLDILDLVVFNEDGQAIIDLNHASLDNDLIHFPWKKRYEDVYKIFKNYEKKITEFQSVKTGFEVFINQKKETLKAVRESQIDTDIKTLNKEIGELKNHLKNSEANILNIEDLKKVKIDCSKIYTPASRMLNMPIKRVRHYKSPYSDDLLQKFMLYLSRNAFEHDFTNG